MPSPWIRHTLPDDRPRLAWPTPGGTGTVRLLVCAVLNVETWPFDKAMPRTLLPAPHGREIVPDVPNFSWVEYGMRVGLPRIVNAFARRGLPMGLSTNAAVCEDYPRAFDLLLRTGWEFVAHGVRQQAVSGVADERELIEASVGMLTGGGAPRPRGWMGPGLAETVRTPQLLAELGFDYVLDWSVDDLPVWMDTDPPLLALPYSLELNDSVVVAVERQPMPEYERRVRDAAALLLAEAGSDSCPRVMALPLHPHLLGVAHRFGGLMRMVDELRADRRVAFVSPGDVCDWYRDQVPARG